MRRMRRRYALVCAALLLVSVPALGQTTGSINGILTDNTGAVLPGATVTAKSPALMGLQVATTNEQGQYRFPSLPPGTYALKCELPGFTTVNREGIIVNIGFTATVNLQLTIAKLVETVTVSGASPVVDVQNSNIQTNITAEMLKEIPNARDIWTVIGQAPGFMVNNFDVGGSRAGTQTGYSAFGYSGQVRVQIDGVNTTEGTNAAGFYYDYGSFEEVQLGADGNDASAATPGLQLNAVLKSGGNTVKGDIYFDYENKSLQGHNVTDELRRVGVNDTRIKKYRDPNLSVGGPIKRDRLWYFGSFRDQQTGVAVAGFPVENPTSDFEFETRLTNISYKLTYQLTQNNRLGHYIQWGRKYQPHRNASSTTYSDAVFKQDSWSWAANVDWHSIVSPRFFFNTRYSTFGYDWPDAPYGLTGEVNTNLRRRMTDNLTGNTAGAFNARQNNRGRHQFDVSGTLFRDDWIHGDHSLKMGLVSEWETQDFTDFGFVDALSLTFNSPTGSADFTRPQRVVLRNTPRQSIDSTWHHGAFFNDQWTLTPRITANVGIRWDYYSSYYPGQNILEGPFRDFFYAGAVLPNSYSLPVSPYAGSFTIPGRSGIREHSSFAPRVGVAWNLFGDNKTVLKANWGRFYFNTGLASSDVNPAQSITYTFNWNDRNGDRQFTMDEIGSFVSSSGGATEQIDPNIKHRYTDNTSVWLERELFQNIGMRVGYTYRTDGNNSQAVELQRLASLYTSQIRVDDPGRDGIAGNADDGEPFIVYDIPSSLLVPSRSETRTVDGILAIDRALDVTFTKRMANRWSLMTSYLYNWDRDRGRPQTPNAERFNDNTVTSWAFKIVGSYRAPFDIVVSPVLRHQSGDSLARIVQATRGLDLASGLVRDINIGTYNYDAEREGDYREDNIWIFDTRLEKRIRMRGDTFSLFLDAFNIHNTDRSESADDTVGRRSVTLNGERVEYQRFLRPTGTLPPRILRFGLKYSF
jgi:hypothetical protein